MHAHIHIHTFAYKPKVCQKDHRKQSEFILTNARNKINHKI